MTINAYPLAWPMGWKRAAERENSRFRKATRREGHGDTARWIPQRDLTVSEGIKRVMLELDRMGLGRDDVVVSTNLKLRLDGLPRSDQREPDDPGVAVYWEDGKGGHKVMAIDRYTSVADNLAAVAATLDAMRAIERHGGAMVLERAFTGFTALPAPTAKRHWREVLGFPDAAHVPRKELLRERFRSRASSAHPDKGGGDAEMSELNVAYSEALEECG